MPNFFPALYLRVSFFIKFWVEICLAKIYYIYITKQTAKRKRQAKHKVEIESIMYSAKHKVEIRSIMYSRKKLATNPFGYGPEAVLQCQS